MDAPEVSIEQLVKAEAAAPPAPHLDACPCEGCRARRAACGCGICRQDAREAERVGSEPTRVSVLVGGRYGWLTLETPCPDCGPVQPARMSRTCERPGCDGRGRVLTAEGRALLDFLGRRLPGAG